MKTIEIQKIGQDPFYGPIDPKNNFWENSTNLVIDNFLGKISSHKPRTNVLVQYSESGFYLHYEVIDKFVLAKHTKHNSNVFEDSCVEFFVEPYGADGYFNFEFNCIGTKLASFIRNNSLNDEGEFTDYQKLGIEDLNSIKVASSLSAPITNEITDSIKWSLATFIPFKIILENTGMKRLNFDKAWKCNFYKCADKSSQPHWASWNPITHLNFHQPTDFGEIIFQYRMNK
jgi:hypothetical protein